jgi:hypothetical protein
VQLGPAVAAVALARRALGAAGGAEAARRRRLLKLVGGRQFRLSEKGKVVREPTISRGAAGLSMDLRVRLLSGNRLTTGVGWSINRRQ